MIGGAFCLLAAYLVVQATLTLVGGVRPGSSALGIGWTAATCVVMVMLAVGKSRTGRLLSNAVLLTEGRVTLVDALLAAEVLCGLILNAAAGWWWADPASGLIVCVYGLREGVAPLRET